YRYSNLSFKRWVELCQPLEYATTVSLYGWGEPLLNPDYERMFDYVLANFPGIEINVSTNGILMNGKWTRRFASCDGLTVNVSLNAASAKTYRFLSQRDEFERIIENIRRLIELRNGRNSGSPLVVLSFVAIRENIVELPDFVRLAARLGADKVVVQDLILLNQDLRKYSLTPYAEFAKSIFLVALNTAREMGISLIPFVPVHFLPTDSDSFEENGRLERKKSARLCLEPWIYLRIAMDGGIQLCCYSNENMGNLYKQSLADIWNGEKFRHYRTRVNSSDLPGDCSKCPKKVGLSL
ncbi:MAG: SPASM domain-containing protein, partial [Candidatus Zixiibacteriota bacterium]